MDLGIIIPFLEKYGGAERFLLECLRKWQHRHDITLYASVINERMLEEYAIGAAVKRTILSPQLDGPHSMLLNAVLLPKIWREEIGRHGLYHAHLWPTHLVDLHPMVWYPHEPLRVLHDLRFEHNVEHIGNEASRNIHVYPKYNYDRIGDVTYEAYLAAIDAADQTSRPERVVANSRYSADYLERVYGREVKDVVYPGVDADQALDLPADRNLFVTVGQLWAHKRINLLIEALALTDDAQLVIIGTGPERERLGLLTEKLGVADRVFFLSGLKDGELRLVLSRACAFLFAPVNEPFGIVVLEAMAAGRPIIAVNQGGYLEACAPEYSFLVPPSPIAFAEKISYLQRHPEIARRMGEASKVAALRFSWSRSADELEAIIEDVYAQSAGSPAAARTPRRTLIGAQYYLWYGDGFGAAHWNDNSRSGYVLDKPYLGYYASSKGQIIEQHFEQMEEMGLDYLALNLHIDKGGLNGIELIGIQHVFDIAARRKTPLRFGIQLAPYTDDAEEIGHAISMIRKLFAPHPNYLEIGGAPVLFWFWSSAHDRNRPLLESLRKATDGFVNLAVGLRLPTADEERRTYRFFSGYAPYSPLELSHPENWRKVWTAGYTAAEKAGMPLRMATISPGYDDSALDDDTRTGNPFRVIEREDGQTYRTGMEFVEELSPRPDLVMISTFNEYHENTHIEVSQKNGTRYRDMTKAFVERWRQAERAVE